MSQPTLFALPAIPAATPDPAVVALAAALPAAVRLGTSTWSFPGWGPLVWGAPASYEALARDGLTAYAAHPLLRTVGVDRGAYAPVPTEVWAGYAAQVPDTFRFLLKAWQGLLWARFPDHDRYGAERGRENPRFLDADAARVSVVDPAIAGLGEKLGPIVFQLPPQPPPPDFATRLRRFLAALPAGPTYAVEIRTPALLGPETTAAIRDAGACPVLTVHPTMPDLRTQWRGLGVPDAPGLIVRWNLATDLKYDDAKAAWAPFDRLRREDPVHRDQIAKAARWALDRGRPAWVVVNNKAEGCAPMSVRRLAERIVGGEGG
jgi:uncharacterized protein YecE (DUF72 family)